MHYLWTLTGEYIGAFDDESLVGVDFDFVEGPAPADARDRLVNGEIVPYVPVAPLNVQVAAAFGALPIEIQDKYLEQITNFRTLFDYGNVPLLLRRLDALAASLDLPAEQAVKDIIDAAKAELGG